MKFYQKRKAITRLGISLIQLTVHGSVSINKDWLLTQLRQIKDDLDCLVRAVENEE